MTTYLYQAINRAGQHCTGQVDAVDDNAARRQLSQRGLFVDTLTAKEEQTASALPQWQQENQSRLNLSPRQRLEFLTQLATALSAQLPIMQALAVVGSQNTRAKIRRLIDQLSAIIKTGQSVSVAFGRYPRIFSQLDLSLIHVGEASGRLDESMSELAEISERDFDTRNTMITASLYPAFVFILGIISIAVVITWILPRIIETLSVDPQLLPWPTRFILVVGTFLKFYGWLVVAALIVVFLGFSHWKRSDAGQVIWDRIKLKMPLYGSLQRQWAVCRFARTLGTLLRGGVNILDALRIVRSSLGNQAMAREIDHVHDHVKQGADVAGPLSHSGLFPPLLVQVVTVGEQSGELDTMLLHAAQAFEKDQQQKVRRVMALFPAIMILVLAIMVGFIVAATLMPIVQLETTIPR